MDENQTLEQDLQRAVERLWSEKPYKIVLSAPRAQCEDTRAVFVLMKTGWQLETMRGKQVFHKNYADGEVSPLLCSLLADSFMQMQVLADVANTSLRVSKKGKLLSSRTAPSGQAGERAKHNREKKYLLAAGKGVAPLVDMGVLTPSGQVVKAMYDKYRQINRFVELVDDALRVTCPKSLRVVDFGCGKSYLTFVLYHFLTAVRGIEVHMTGLDLKADVVEKCNTAAEKYGYANLQFQVGDIADFTAEGGVDMVVTLHACDTATDTALAKAVGWGASMIFSVPCCQHELNAQIRSEKLALLTRYGIVQERTAALMTDAIRANLLEACGYRAQILEFVDFTHTPKNLLIRATKANLPQAKRAQAMEEVHRLCAAFELTPTLLRLLQQQKELFV